MSESFGFKCPTCEETLFGISWLQGQRVIFSNCTCGGPLKFARVISLKQALRVLGPCEKKSNNERRREKEEQKFKLYLIR